MRIFFPWEVRGGLRRTLGLGRLRPFLVVTLLALFIAWIVVRERQKAGIRQTRATLLDLRSAIEAYMAAHDGACPPDLAAITDHRRGSRPPLDAWGRPFRLICPSHEPDLTYELMSDGPDGLPGGLDRIQ
jgi:general secretion pathway protein G